MTANARELLVAWTLDEETVRYDLRKPFQLLSELAVPSYDQEKGVITAKELVAIRAEWQE